jgi:hypothetical protein
VQRPGDAAAIIFAEGHQPLAAYVGAAEPSQPRQSRKKTDTPEAPQNPVRPLRLPSRITWARQGTAGQYGLKWKGVATIMKRAVEKRMIDFTEGTPSYEHPE